MYNLNNISHLFFKVRTSKNWGSNNRNWGSKLVITVGDYSWFIVKNAIV